MAHQHCGTDCRRHSGLSECEDSGAPLSDTLRTAIASSLLSALFSTCLSPARKAANGAAIHDALRELDPDDEHMSLLPLSGGSINSLSAAMSAAAASTFSTTPFELGEAHGWRLGDMCEWIEEHAVKAHPKVLQSVGRPGTQEHSMADVRGGGQSAGGLNYSFFCEAEEGNQMMTAMSAREVEEHIRRAVRRILRPYKRLAKHGAPALAGGMLLLPTEAMRGLGDFALALGSWASAHVVAHRRGDVGSECASFAAQAARDYRVVLEAIGARTRSRRRDRLDRDEIEEELLEAGAGARLAWIVSSAALRRLLPRLTRASAGAHAHRRGRRHRRRLSLAVRRDTHALLDRRLGAARRRPRQPSLVQLDGAARGQRLLLAHAQPSPARVMRVSFRARFFLS